MQDELSNYKNEIENLHKIVSRVENLSKEKETLFSKLVVQTFKWKGNPDENENFLDDNNFLKILDQNIWQKLHQIIPVKCQEIYSIFYDLIITNTDNHIRIEKQLIARVLTSFIIRMRDDKRNFLGKYFGAILQTCNIPPYVI